MSDDFLKAMADVIPLKQHDKVVNHNKAGQSQAQLAKRAAAEQHLYLSQLTTDVSLIKPIGPDDIVTVKAEGIQEAVFKRLRNGKYKHEWLLDLHEFRVRQARDALVNFILASYNAGERNVLVIHGKGYKSKPFAGLMKSCVCHWLAQFDEVQAFHSCLREHGGTGALYVMLKKNEQLRIEARETNHKGSGFR